MSLICPVCTRPAFTVSRLLSLTPFRRARCHACGASLTVAWPMFALFTLALVNLPAIAALIALFYVWVQFGPLAGSVAGIASGVVVGMPLAWLYARCARLLPATSVPPIH